VILANVHVKVTLGDLHLFHAWKLPELVELSVNNNVVHLRRSYPNRVKVSSRYQGNVVASGVGRNVMILPREPLWLGLLLLLAVTPCFAQDQPKPKQDVHPAVLIYKVSPDYPDSWKRQGIQGVVHLRATLTKEGTVRDVKVIDGIPLLAKSAETAVKQWRYKPTTVDGVPVDVQTDFAISFSLTPAKR
jgi:TonB family protein